MCIRDSEYTERKKRLSYLRLYHGTLHLRDTLLLSKKEKIKITEMCLSLIHIYGKSFPEAVQLLTGESGEGQTEAATAPPTAFHLPLHNSCLLYTSRCV